MMATPHRLLVPAIALALLTIGSTGGWAGSDNADDSKSSASSWTKLLSPATKSLDDRWVTTGNWTLENGVATLTPRPGEEGWERFSAYLWSKETHGDFIIEFDYKLQQHGNSGFYFRVGDRDDPVQQGIEVQLYESASKPEGAKLSDHDSGGIIPGVPPVKRASRPAGQWNTMRVKNVDDKLIVILNGVTVNTVDLSTGPLAKRPHEGWIGFQDHGMPMSLRRIRIREVSSK